MQMEIKMDRVFKIVELLHKQKACRLTEEEKSELAAWLSDDKNRKLAERLSQEEEEQKAWTEHRHYNAEKAYARFSRMTDKRKLSWRYWGWVAAVLLPLTCVTIFLLQEDELEERTIEYVSTIPGGRGHAILTLSGGDQVVLGETQPSYSRMDSSVFLTADSMTLHYRKKKELSDQLSYNELYVPRRGEYVVCLSDGSRIFLNADTRLRYPEVFGDGPRVVELTGEAYFEVASDSLHPFIVKTSEGMEVQVLGTVFNINAYTENTEIRTTLVKGCVAVGKEEKLVLTPGEQACFRKDGNGIYKRDVNVSLYTGWKDGLFKFRRESLENIMMILMRWYDIQVSFQNETLKQLLFTGDLKKYDSIEEHLEMLEMTTNINFEIQGDRVVIGYKND